jgi:site-specific DNA-methyltransferase (adenine-specific)
MGAKNKSKSVSIALPQCRNRPKIGSFKLDRVIYGDAKLHLQKIPDSFADLVFTSPPYADSRKRTYGGIHPDDYVDWFAPFGEQLLRVLKPTGSFVLNIKEKVVNGERHTYVIDLIHALKKQGWLWTEEYIWHKKNCYPGKWPNRFRDAWERCLQFTKNKDFHMYQDSVRVPMGNWKDSRLRKLSETDRRRDESKVNSGFGKKIENWIGRELAYPTNVLRVEPEPHDPTNSLREQKKEKDNPTNVLHLATECGNKNHSAAFPEALPAWFINLFTQSGDVVLDPFLGSGTTAIAARRLGRHFIGIELKAEYCELARNQLGNFQPEFEAVSSVNGH